MVQRVKWIIIGVVVIIAIISNGVILTNMLQNQNEGTRSNTSSKSSSRSTSRAEVETREISFESNGNRI